jgi:hypothetical protein
LLALCAEEAAMAKDRNRIDNTDEDAMAREETGLDRDDDLVGAADDDEFEDVDELDEEEDSVSRGSE